MIRHDKAEGVTGQKEGCACILELVVTQKAFKIALAPHGHPLQPL